MSEPTPRIETNDGINVLIINGKLSRETTARHIVKMLDAHDALVEALEATRHSLIDMDESAYGPQLQYEIGVITAALEAVGSRNGEAKR